VSCELAAGVSKVVACVEKLYSKLEHLHTCLDAVCWMMLAQHVAVMLVLMLTPCMGTLLMLAVCFGSVGRTALWPTCVGTPLWLVQ
jgi:hypothetical protein